MERTAQASVLPVVRNDEQENPRERCYYSLPASFYCDFSQGNATEMRSIQNKLGESQQQKPEKNRKDEGNTTNKIEFQHNYT